MSMGQWVERYLRVGEAQNPRPIEIEPLQTEIVTEDGTSTHIMVAVCSREV